MFASLPGEWMGISEKFGFSGGGGGGGGEERDIIQCLRLLSSSKHFDNQKGTDAEMKENQPCVCSMKLASQDASQWTELRDI